MEAVGSGVIPHPAVFSFLYEQGCETEKVGVELVIPEHFAERRGIIVPELQPETIVIYAEDYDGLSKCLIISTEGAVCTGQRVICIVLVRNAVGTHIHLALIGSVLAQDGRRPGAIDRGGKSDRALSEEIHEVTRTARSQRDGAVSLFRESQCKTIIMSRNQLSILLHLSEILIDLVQGESLAERPCADQFVRSLDTADCHGHGTVVTGNESAVLGVHSYDCLIIPRKPAGTVNLAEPEVSPALSRM